jgi:TPR repeat protein
MGSPEGCFTLVMYFNGDHLNVDIDRAQKLFKKALEGGISTAELGLFTINSRREGEPVKIIYYPPQ